MEGEDKVEPLVLAAREAQQHRGGLLVVQFGKPLAPDDVHFPVQAASVEEHVRVRLAHRIAEEDHEVAGREAVRDLLRLKAGR